MSDCWLAILFPRLGHDRQRLLPGSVVEIQNFMCLEQWTAVYKCIINYIHPEISASYEIYWFEITFLRSFWIRLQIIDQNNALGYLAKTCVLPAPYRSNDMCWFDRNKIDRFGDSVGYVLVSGQLMFLHEESPNSEFEISWIQVIPFDVELAVNYR